MHSRHRHDHRAGLDRHASQLPSRRSRAIAHAWNTPRASDTVSESPFSASASPSSSQAHLSSRRITTPAAEDSAVRLQRPAIAAASISGMFSNAHQAAERSACSQPHIHARRNLRASIKAKAGIPAAVPMLLSVIIVIAICAITSAVRVARGVIPTDLGSMSEKWIADYRGSREW